MIRYRQTRRWFRFSLRAALLGVALLAGVLGFVSHERRVQMRAASTVELYGGRTETFPRLLGLVDALFSVRGLEGSGFNDNDLEVVCRARTVEELHINGTAITDDGMRHIRRLRQLKLMDISNTRIGDSGLTQLGSLRSLRLLLASNIEASDEQLADFLSRCPNIEVLDVSGTNAGKGVCAALSSSKYLYWCSLDETKVCDDAIDRLDSPPALEGLWLRGTAVTAEGISPILAAPSLKSVDVRQTAISDSDLRELRQRHPGVIFWPLDNNR